MILKFYLKILSLYIIFQSIPIYSYQNNYILSKKQEINIGNGGELKTLDPQKCNDNTCINIVGQLFEGLVSMNKYGEIIPASAESWKISSDGKKYTFILRNHLKWSDGSDLTALDFVYSFRRLVDPKIASERASIFEHVLNGKEIIEGHKPVCSLGVRALNKSTIEIELSKPIPILLEYLSTTLTYPVQEKNVEKFKDSFTKVENLISNGPFVLNFRKVGDKLTIVKNNNYWRQNEVYLNKVHFFSVSDQVTEYQMYETGQIDITSRIPINQYNLIKKKHTSELINNPISGTYSYFFNNQKAPFNNQKIRNALNIAIDREVISKIIVGMGEKPLYDVVPYGVKNYQQGHQYWQDWPREKQIEEAKKLYRESGYSSKSPLSFVLLYNNVDIHKKIANAISTMWKKNLGVNVRLINEEWNVLIDKLRNGDFEVIRKANVASINDASDFLFPFRSDDSNNTSKYSNPEFDVIVSKAAIEMDQIKRKKLLEKAGKILLNDSPIVPIYSFSSSYLLKPYIVNFSKDSLNERFSLVGVYVKNKIDSINQNLH